MRDIRAGMLAWWRRAAGLSGSSGWPLRLAALGLPLLAFVLAAGQSWQRGQAEAAAELLRRTDLLEEQVRRAFEARDALLAMLQWQLRDRSWPAEIAGHAELAALLAELRRSAPGTGSPGPAALAVTPPGHQDPPPEEAAPPVVPPG
ncbi:hypothetical protein JYK14_27705, partial [Siccirubricoccus sp. KC 17139]